MKNPLSHVRKCNENEAETIGKSRIFIKELINCKSEPKQCIKYQKNNVKSRKLNI